MSDLSDERGDGDGRPTPTDAGARPSRAASRSTRDQPAAPAAAGAARRVAAAPDAGHVADSGTSPVTTRWQLVDDGDDDPSPRLGLHTATVADDVDPEGAGRVQVTIPPPNPPGRAHTLWARVATLMAGADRGTWFVPAVGDEVLVAFEQGDPDRAVVIGSLWSPQAPPPVASDQGSDVRLIKSRAGTEIEFDDSPQPRLTLRTPAGNRVELDEQAGRIIIDDGAGNEVVLEPTGITIQAATKIRIEGSIVEIAGGVVKIESGMTQFAGVVQADTVIATNVVASTVSPAAGNTW